MKHLALALVCAAISASSASGQEFADVPGLKEGLSAIKSQALGFKPEALPSPQKTIEDSHRLGHSTRFSPASAQEAPDISSYPVRGIDVSHYEDDIQWDKVKAQGISFAFIKATEGSDYVDPAFQANWKGASGAGIARGAYHFYNFCKGGAEQADNFIKTVPREGGALPMVLDLEESNSCRHMPRKPAFLKDLAAFVKKIQAAYGVAPILYINFGIYNEYLSGASGGYKLWIADPSHAAPRMPDGESWTFWQYSWHGRVGGISSEVDLDVFSGDLQALAQLARQ